MKKIVNSLKNDGYDVVGEGKQEDIGYSYCECAGRDTEHIPIYVREDGRAKEISVCAECAEASE